jgi:hypothetical protein
LSIQFGIPKLAIDAAAWGVVGSLLRGIWYLWKNVNDRKFRKVWIVWLISTPFLGAILGSLIYFLISAGLIVI